MAVGTSNNTVVDMQPESRGCTDECRKNKAAIYKREDRISCSAGTVCMFCGLKLTKVVAGSSLLVCGVVGYFSMVIGCMLGRYGAEQLTDRCIKDRVCRCHSAVEQSSFIK